MNGGPQTEKVGREGETEGFKDFNDLTLSFSFSFAFKKMFFNIMFSCGRHSGAAAQQQESSGFESRLGPFCVEFLFVHGGFSPCTLVSSHSLNTCLSGGLMMVVCLCVLAL